MKNNLFFIQCDKWLNDPNRPDYISQPIENINNFSITNHAINLISTGQKVRYSFLKSIENKIIFNHVKKYLEHKINDNSDVNKIAAEVQDYLKNTSDDHSNLCRTIGNELLDEPFTLYFYLHGTDFLDRSVGHLSITRQEENEIKAMEQLSRNLKTIGSIQFLVIQQEILTCEVFRFLSNSFEYRHDKTRTISELIKKSKMFNKEERELAILQLLNYYNIKMGNEHLIEWSSNDILRTCEEMSI